MVENKGNFGFPHNLSYEDGTYHRRYFYPRVVCCRRGRGMMEEETSPAQSPLASPQHRPLLAHVQGSAVVSKIARPKNAPGVQCSTSASSPNSSSSPGGPLAASSPISSSSCVSGTKRTADPGYSLAGGEERGGTLGSAFIRNTPDLVPRNTVAGGGEGPPDLSRGSEVILDQPLTSAGLGYPHVNVRSKVIIPASNDNQPPASKDQGERVSNRRAVTGDRGTERITSMCDAAPTEDGTLLPATPESPGEEEEEGRENTHRPVFRLSDASDYSEDYTDMTGGTLDGDNPPGGDITSPPMNGSDMNGSSVFSDVFSDRSSDTVGTQELLEDDLPPGLVAQLSDDGVGTVTDNNEEDEDLGLNQSLINRVLKLDIGTAQKLSQQMQGHDDVVNDDEVEALSLADDLSDVLSPPLSTPEIQVEEIALQEDNLKEVSVPLEDGDTKDNKGGFYEDREFDFLKAQPKVKRSTSLKTYKTPPGTPKRKMVRFADALGLDLESVRHILNMEAPPKIPQSATRDLDLEDDDDEKRFFKTPVTGGARYLTACFSQPGSNPSFPLMVRDRNVILESAVIHDPNLSVTGTIRVANISYHKKVLVRYTTNNWLTFNDIDAGYVQGSNDGPTDRFSFTISLPNYFSTGSRLQFCIQYVAGGETFWDNNHGGNYVVECFARALPDSDNTWMSFL